MARTIDNLGVETSTRYASDREFFDETYIKDARSMASQITINTTSPSHLLEFDVLFDLGARRASWGTFSAPPQYYAYRGRNFAEQVIPQLGTPDKQETQATRVEAVGEEEKKKQTLPNEKQKVESETQALLKLFGTLGEKDQDLIAINSRRAQYQKG